MYRDDVCAVCGDSLPPDHLYCREHAAEVDDRLHEIAELVPDVLDRVTRLAELVGGIADETWDYVADGVPDEPEWPPTPVIAFRADAEEVDVEVDAEPGFVRAELRVPLARLLAAFADGLDTPELRRLAGACAAVEGASVTH